MFKKITSICAAVIMTFAVSVTAFADENNYTKEYIIDEYWTQYWEDSLPGEENPEGSLEYHLLEEWLDENYDKTEYETGIDWSSSYSISKAWKNYYNEKTECWHYVDDYETGEFYIGSYDPDTDTYSDDKLYTFTYADGKWNMVDSNGNIVDSFDPHGGDGSWYAIQNDSDEDVTFNVNGYINGEYYGNDSEYISTEPQVDYEPYDDDNDDNNDVETEQSAVALAPTTTEETDEETVTEESTDEENSTDSSESSESSSDESSPLPYIAGGIALVAAGGAAGYFVSRRRKKI